MTKNNQQQKQIDTQLPGANFTDTELGQELANIHQEVSQLIQTVSQFQHSPQGVQTNQASNSSKKQMESFSSQAQQQKTDQQEETPKEKHNIRDYDRAWEDDRL
ncbi:hypothetical protein EI200_21790 [Peribacillus simplex]|uniref:hypothetical protein n=1 Tax=Peribacillus simplex TaxID=1478 RepID=UPI000F62F35E|nr:hypothetical protein [Peribacillus simplex]RRN67749.1 hypothetical protein EI200_21790 [Peribacillus simplex]